MLPDHPCIARLKSEYGFVANRANTEWTYCHGRVEISLHTQSGGLWGVSYKVDGVVVDARCIQTVEQATENYILKWLDDLAQGGAR